MLALHIGFLSQIDAYVLLFTFLFTVTTCVFLISTGLILVIFLIVRSPALSSIFLFLSILLTI